MRVQERRRGGGGRRLKPRAVLSQRCAECGEGRVFRSSLGMNETCPCCGCRFERGPGYFTGAMYFSYALGIPIIAAGTAIGRFWLAPSWPMPWVIVAAWAAFLPLAPAVFRYSRVLFIHLDRYLDPEGPGD